MAKYLEVVEHLLTKKPQDKELVFTMYEGSLHNNNFGQAAKMAAKMAQSFNEPAFSLPQIQCLYMDSQKHLGGTGNPMALGLAIAFAEKFMAKKQEQNEEGAPIPQYFTKLYLKMLIAKKEFDKSTDFL